MLPKNPMNIDPSLLVSLQKSNVDLYVTLANLLVKSEMQMAQASMELFNQYKALAQPKSAQTDQNTWATTPLALMQQHRQLSQAFTDTCMNIQKELGEEVQKTLANWHHHTLGMFENDKGDLPFTSAMQKQLNQFFSLMTPSSSAKKD